MWFANAAHAVVDVRKDFITLKLTPISNYLTTEFIFANPQLILATCSFRTDSGMVNCLVA